MICPVCREEMADGQRIVYNHRTTFVFKPANVPDTVNPAKVTQDELFESRKEHTKTEVATTYTIMGRDPIPEGAFGIRHQDCVKQTGTNLNNHAQNKHSVRWRNAGRRMH